MEILKEIFQKAGINTQGKTLYRDAVRGIVLRKHDILMIYSPVNGDYKFPGGGVDADESYQETLAREIQEECGAQLSRIEGELGCVIEYNSAGEPGYDAFKMTSRYYLCRIFDGFREQELDRYERDLGFRPVWVDVDAAIQANNMLLGRTEQKIPPWTLRETFVLSYIKNHLLS